MLPKAISARRFADGHPVMDVVPMIGRNLDRIDAARLDGVDELEHALNLRPAIDMQQDLCAGRDRRNGLARCAAFNRAQDVEPRENGAVLVRRPAHEREDAAGREEEDATATIEDLLAPLRPKRIQCSVCFSIQMSSTWVNASGGGSAVAPRTRIGAATRPVIILLLRGVGIRVRTGRGACRRQSGRAGRPRS